MSVLLAEQDDLAAHTSSWSTKLIHGGLRYLEYFEFRLVAEALREREVLLANAPHIIEPLAFVLPYEAHLRPAWMIRVGLFLYDHLGGRMTLPKSFGVKLAGSRWGAGLQSKFVRGFVYADARVDDARLVVLNALDAKGRGADIRVHTRVTGARREGGLWRATLQASDGVTTDVKARAIVNAAGPWVKHVLDSVSASPTKENVRHVKGSHIVVPARASGRARVHPAKRRQADRLHHSLPAALLADRHDGHPRRRIRASGDHRRRDRLSARTRQFLSREAARRHPTWSGRTAACGRCTTTARPTPPR